MKNSTLGKKNLVVVRVLGALVVTLGLFSFAVSAQEPLKRTNGSESQAKGGRSVAPAPPTSTERTQEQKVADVQRVLLGAITRLVVTLTEESYLEVSMMRGPTAVQSLGLEFEETTQSWQPIVPDNLRGTLWGPDLSRGFGSKDGTRTGTSAAAQIDLQPFDPSIVNIPHDDVSVFVVDGELVLISLWNQGMNIGVYYVLAADDGDGGVAIVDNSVAVGKVCMTLLDTCLGQKDTYWVQACGSWLQFCAGLQQ